MAGFKKEFVDIPKVAYLRCCPQIKLVAIKPPKNTKSKVRFELEAPYEKYLTILEKKWDGSKRVGNPSILYARRFYWLINKMHNQAKAICRYKAHRSKKLQAQKNEKETTADNGKKGMQS